MNVIVSYKQKDIIDNANIDAIKDLNGLFNVGDLIDKFKNYFFSKMILDATSVENFASREVLTQLVDGIGADRLIILLPETPPPPDEFKKLLIDLRIYNFSNNINDVVRFIDSPNTYENAIGTISNMNLQSDGYVDNSIRGNEDMFNPRLTDDGFSNQNDHQDESHDEPENNIEDEQKYEDEVPEDGKSFENVLSSFNTDSSDNNKEDEDSSKYEEYKEENAFQNTFEKSIEEKHDEEDNPKEEVDEKRDLKSVMYKNDEEKEEKSDKKSFVFLNMDGFDNLSSSKEDRKVIGFRNVTLHAGSTSLIHMLLKSCIENLKKNAIAVEIGKNDFRLFLNNKMFSIEEEEASEYIKSHHESVIFVDLNDCKDDEFCDSVIYLVEPSIIMLNRLMAENQKVFNTLSDKKVILNKSLLSKSDIRTLSSEANVDFLFNIEPVNDRVDNEVIHKLLDILDIK